MPPSGPPQRIIVFAADVTQASVGAVARELTDCTNAGFTRIEMQISTGGGNVESGFSLHNLMRAVPIEITTHNTGSVASIGTVIFLAGEYRLATPASSFMFHGAAMKPTDLTLDQRRLRELLSTVEMLNNRMGEVIQSRTRLTADAVSAFWLEERQVRADAALEQGIVHEIAEPVIAPGTPVVTITG